MKVFAIIVAVIALILCLRVKVVVEAPDEFRLTVWVGFIPIRILPTKEKHIRLRDWTIKKYRGRLEKENAPEKKGFLSFFKKSKKKPKASEKSAKGGETKKKTDIPELIRRLTSTAGAALSCFGKHLRIDLYRFRVVAASDDAAKTAVMYGAVIAAVQNLWAVLCSYSNLHTHRDSVLLVDVDFTRTKPVFDIKLGFSLRVWHAFAILFRAALAYLKSGDDEDDDIQPDGTVSTAGGSRPDGMSRSAKDRVPASRG